MQKGVNQNRTEQQNQLLQIIKNNKICWETARLIYKSVLAPMMLYGPKDAALTNQNRRRLRIYERMMVANKDKYRNLKTTTRWQNNI